MSLDISASIMPPVGLCPYDGFSCGGSDRCRRWIMRPDGAVINIFECVRYKPKKQVNKKEETME